jgi:HEAT repeat protein
VRFTLTSLARYVSQKGHEKEWEWLQRNFLKAIQTSSVKEVQSYLIEQLIYGANDQCVDALGRYLADSYLCVPVTGLFQIIATEKAKNALVEAMPVVIGTNQISVVKALGDLQYKAAIPAITKLDGSNDTTLQRTVLLALANIGSVESYDLLWQAAVKLGFADDPTGALTAFLVYCDQLGNENELKLCKKGCLAVIKANQKENLLHNQAAALRIYSKYYTAETMPLLLKAAKNSERSFRMAVLDIAVKLEGTSYTTQWVKLAKKESATAVTADIIYMLGERADRSAESFIRESLNNKYAEIRTEAVWALVKLDPQTAVNVLISHLSKGNDVEVTEMAVNQV